MRWHKKQIVSTSRSEHPDNLLDLNRSLPNYAYHPADSTQPAMQQPIETEKPRRRWKKIVGWTLAVLLFFGVTTGGWVGWKLISNEIKVFGWGGVFSLFRDNKLAGESSGHVNLLLAGNSADDANHGGAALTDSIMIVSINTNTHSGFMLSVPRDLYVNIPGHGYAKINEAYEDGEADHFSEGGYAGGGMGLLEKTISQDFGITFNYYALVNYQAVRDAVNAVGGITVTINSNDPRGLYDPSPDLNNNYKPLVKLPNGPDKINGTQALGLARARGDHYGAYGYAQSDFTRTQNQRLIMVGLKDKALSLGTLSNPVKIGELFDSIGGNVKTDLSLGNVRRLYQIVKPIPDSSIKSAGLNNSNGANYLASYTNQYGQSTLIPRKGIDNYSEIQAYVQSLLNPPAASSSK